MCTRVPGTTSMSADHPPVASIHQGQSHSPDQCHTMLLPRTLPPRNIPPRLSARKRANNRCTAIRLLHITMMVLSLPNLFVPFSIVTVHCDPLPLTSSSSASSSSSSAPSSAMLFASSSVNFRCPEQFGYYADEYNCSKYFVCVFGEALHESCTGGLRFSSELQTCDWPRNVVCPSEDLDSSYDDNEEDGGNHESGTSNSNSNSHSKATGSGMVQEVTTARSGLIDGYVKEANTATQLGTAGGKILSHRPQQLLTTTPAPTTSLFTTEETSSAEQINEAAVQESFDKLSKVKNSRGGQKYRQAHKPSTAANPSITYEFVKSNVPDNINHMDINTNKLDANGTHEADLNGEDLDENFTLVDLQRSRVSLDGGKSFRATDGSNKNFDDNILGTIGRSINGANRAQSVSVVASTSSEAIIPELDFVFKKPPSTGAVQDKNRGRNRISLGDVQTLPGHFVESSVDTVAGGTPKFDEAITAIVDENGAIHIDGEEGSALLRIIAPLSKKGRIFSGKNSLPGTAASNRNTASQQVLLAKNMREELPPLEDKAPLSFQTSQNSRALEQPLSGSGTSESDPLEALDIKTLKTGAGTILVFNRTQLITVAADSADGNPSNSSSTFILIDHQQPTATVQDGRESLLSEYELSEQLKLNHRVADRPRQAIVVRTEKDDTGLQVGGQLKPEVVRNRNTAGTAAVSSANNKTVTVQHIGSKERAGKARTTTTPASTAAILNEDVEDIDLLVEIAPNSPDDVTTEDFQRIRLSQANRGVTNSTDPAKRTIGNSEFRQPKYLPDSMASKAAVNATTGHAVPRTSQGRHLGSHNRAGGSTRSNPSHNRTSASQKLSQNVTLQTPARPSALYQTPEPFSVAGKCSEETCRLPDCFCGGSEIPGTLPVKDVPQLVLISFDDAVNDVNWHIYEELLNSGRSNPNGCPIKGTFYLSHEWTDYSQVQTLYSRGHEIASHSITHGFGERFTKQQWQKEIVGQREILHLYGGVNRADIRGMRAPFLQGGGNKQFEMLHEENFTYDSSMPVFENSPPFWPYTLDYAINHECMIAPCPTKSFPGLWEIGLVMWQDLGGGRCSMGDACSNPTDEDGVYEMIMKNFKRHYNSNRAPFGLYYHSAWFNSEHHRRGFLRVIDDLLAYHKDVYFVTKWELLQWIRNPTPLKELYRVNLFGCARDPHRPPPCLHPNICNIGSHSGSRFLKTCQPCPKRYPWLDDNGQ